jgi:hypothetical protein
MPQYGGECTEKVVHNFKVKAPDGSQRKPASFLTQEAICMALLRLVVPAPASSARSTWAAEQFSRSRRRIRFRARQPLRERSQRFFA